MNKNADTRGKVMRLLFILCVMIAIFVFLYFWLKGSRTTTSEEIVNNDSVVLTCDFNGSSDNFFMISGELSPKHSVRVMFDGDNIDKYSYMYNASFSSEAIAKDGISRMHGKYNIYMRDVTGVYQEDFLPQFSVVQNKGSINLFIPVNLMNPGVAKLVFLNDDEAVKVKEYTVGELEGIYSKKGFTCNRNY